MTLLQEYLFSYFSGISAAAIGIGYRIFWSSDKKCSSTFQKYYGYVADGLVGPTLWNDIVSAYQFI